MAGSAGKGGDGVVIVRISLVVDGPIEKPQYKEVNYTGNEITIIDSIPGVYKVTGDYKKTNVSDTPYEYTVTLEPGFKWSDGTDAPVTQTWKILPGHLTMPAPTPAAVTYDEANHVVVTASPNYEFLDIGTGNNATNATNVGDYRYEVKLTDEINWRWADGSTTNLVYNWSILPRPVPQQALPTGLVFGYTNVVAVTNNEHFYTFTPDSVTNAAHAGTYKITYVLTDPANNCWADGSTTNQTYWWTIARLPVDRPPIPKPVVFDNAYHEAATNSIYWTRDGNYEEINARKYEAILVLNDDWCWTGAAAEDRGSTEDFVFNWQIAQATNEIYSISRPDYKLGETPKPTSCTAKFGADTAIYEYGRNPSGIDWSPDLPETNGVFYVRVTIPEDAAHRNWSGAVRTKRFLVYKSFEELYTDFVDIEFPSYQGEARENTVVLIKISEDIFKGFSYARCDGGDKLAFMDFTEGQANSPLSFEVDTWKVSGESLVWVKIPHLESAKTKIRMYWHLREGMEAPGESPEDVWSDYAGVWHFAEEIGTTGADTAISPDSSGHGYDAIPAKGSSGNLSNMVSEDGMIGLARKNASGNYATGGNRFAITNFENCSTLGTNFIFSGWVYFYDYGTTHAPWIIGRKGVDEEDGWGLALNASARKKFDIYGVATNQFTTTAAVTTYDMKQHWEYVTLAVSGSRYWLYTRSKDNGNNVAQGTLTSPVGGGQTALAFGSSNDGMKPSANAKFDEFRLRPWNVRFDGGGAVVTEDLEALKDEVNFEFYSITNIDHAETHGWVSKEGVLQNYWTRLPSISKTSWEKTDPPADVDYGAAATGMPFYVVERLFSEGLYMTNALPADPGKYSITFYVEVEGFNTLKEVKTFSILGHSDYNVIGQTEEGRILLANDDSMGDWGDLSVTNQAYWMTHFVDYHCQSSVVKRVIDHGKWVYQTNWYPYVVTTTNSTYWTHGGDTLSSSSIRPFLQLETTHTLETTNKIDSLCGGSRLWHLENVRIGNIFREDETYWNNSYNYLPWSPTSCAISSNGAVFARSEVGNLVLRNTTAAQIFSACYTNGIGTIYFDAVNAYKFDNFPAADAHLIVEVATCVTNEFGEVLYDSSGQKLLPTDENVIDCGWRTNLVWSEDGSTCTTNIAWYSNETYCARAKWEPKAATMIRYLGGAVTKYSPSETIVPYISSSTGTTNDFYRIYVPVNVREPARFRIRRSTKCDAQLIDQNAYILLDNLIVSKPPMRADMESMGTIDMTKKGPNVLGFECATSVPYPAATDEDIYGRARAYYQTSGDDSVDPSAFVKGVTLHYRWRYLAQNPYNQTDWKTVEMRSRGGLIETYEPLEHPLAEGDIEYWYETSLQAPYYSYVDYSGSGHGMKGADGKLIYTEEIQTVVNKFGDTDEFKSLGVANLPSLGTDWFFRLRNGHDLHGSAALVVDEGPLRGKYPMHLAEDNVWRCLLPLPKTTTVPDGTSRSGWREVSTDGLPCKFYFEIYDEQTPGALALEKNTVCYHPVDEMKSIPAKGKVAEGRDPREFTIDHAATHLEWRLNDKFETFAVTRAEYQDFNDWSDAHGPKDVFYANATETNGVNLVDMKTYPAKIATWSIYEPANTNWNETFYLPGYDEDYGYPREEIFPSHATPNNWSGDYIAFVQEKLGGALTHKSGSSSEYHPYPLNSGMAGKIVGQGKGKMNFQLDSRPDGLERITFRAHLGQSLEEEHFAWSQTKLWESNYKFTALATMSHLVTDNNSECDMAAGASLSMIAYYRPGVGFYEFRIERIETGAWTMMSLWKWHYVNGTLTPDCLCKRRMNVQMWTNNSNAPKTSDNIGTANSQNPQYRLMFISAENAGTSTKIYGGISYAAQLPYKEASGVVSENSFNQMGNGYVGLYYEDDGSRHQTPLRYGSYGVAARNCPAEFLRPKHGGPIPAVNDSTAPKQGLKLVAHPTANNDWEFLVGRDDPKAQYFRYNNAETNSRDIGCALDALEEDWGDIAGPFGEPYVETKWTLPPKRIETHENEWKTGMKLTHHGLRMPTDLKQNVFVLTATKERPGEWTTVATKEVTGYGFKDYDIPLYLKGQYNVRLTTDADAVDVVVDDVKQTQWMGKSGADDSGSVDYSSDRFVYTQGHVITNTTTRRIEIELTPSRAHAGKSLSVRSPIIDGMGKISFDYANADPNAEIWVQMATNDVDATTLTGPAGYNDSIKSVDDGQQQKAGEWITLAKYTYANASKPEFALGPSGTKTWYVGLHDQEEQGLPIRGVFRLFIPAAKVEYTDTRTSAQLDAGDKDYGRITITGLTVWDEPGLDDRSWRGWNMRTIGDDADSEKRMYLCDMTLVGREGEDRSGYGLVGALNNSTKGAIDRKTGKEDPVKTRTGFPAIWSPTLGTYTNEYRQATQALVGEVTFKARVYDNAKKLKGGRVTLWGASNSIVGREKWTKIEPTFEITEPYLQNFSWKAGGEQYAAIRFEVTDDSAKSESAEYDRVVIDEITITERVAPTLSFTYAWPFRDGLDGTEPIANIGAREQQPLCGENWGVQAKLTLQQLGDDVDLDRGLEVYLSYFTEPPTESNWGYENWRYAKTGEVKLVQVGDASNLVFRSVSAVPESVMMPSPDPGTVVQFMLTVKYWDKGGFPYSDTMHSWTPPSWYHPVDYNESLGVKSAGFAAFTILDRVSPGRAWINEINWNNGGKKVTQTDEKVVDNQFMEVCVPSGMDMSGWKVRAYDRNGDFYDIATFGTLRVASSKTSARAVNGYEFFVLMSPATQKAGKLRDVDGGLVEPDGIWSMTSNLAGLDGGTFSYSQPYAFELIRPSGVVEQSFTIDGTNDWGTVRYDATNLLAVLNAMDNSPSRFYAGREQEKNVNGGRYAPRGSTYGSSGVVRERGNNRIIELENNRIGEEGLGPGSEGTWVHGLDFTVGSVNQGQTIPEGWFLPPNGTNSWVYFTVAGDHLAQRIGVESGRSILVVLPQGVSTNVTYAAAPWWETASVTVNGAPLYEHRPGEWTMNFRVPEDIGSTVVNVLATEGVDSRLDDDKFKLRGQRYRNAVLNWLGQEKWKDKDPDDIRFARMAQLRTPEATHEMTLIDMYWLDICPFNSEGSVFESMDPPKSEWVLRAGFTDYAPNSVVRMRGGEEILNSVFKVKMFVTNEFDHAAYAPYTLQGIGNERSCDGNWSGNNWTSETFKINGFLDVNGDGGFNRGFLPFREFVFHRGSFAPATAGEGTRTAGGVPGEPGAFETVIELIDPFSGLSTPGVSYGWWRWPRSTSAYFNWRITHTNASPMSVEYLMPKSTYGD